MQFRFFHVDAFTGEAFKGNPAAVCLLDTMPSDEILSSIGKENNLPMTAFLLAQHGDYILRWFLPNGEESKLCGHATLASAHVLWESAMKLADETIRFHTAGGLLTATKGEDGWITLNFPAIENTPMQHHGPMAALFPRAKEVLATNSGGYLVVLPTEAEVREYSPNAETLKPYRITITALADTGKPYDFVSRFFMNHGGSPEDPVTGSAHCSLVPYYAQVLNKTDFDARQVSPRGGILKVGLRGNRVDISGQAVTVVDGWYNL
ncbi:MAG: PhzF family phenazine biosynthesis protein [Chitinophaga sp.]|uniref:PhzF family phenazine biosynthesis protein n=1 Tax=Chitinophaga sp. TaxID=1869181 RepID=UPI0025C0CF92|nr:PhzF family phenazine biosynthesis protein [Chitinophaga sp.]MBV8253716.1 PhzF family phenazine biosynthesis protein [Chitinophaga sp.]